VGLSGTLDTFSLPEILLLVEHARQTGALTVTGPEGHGALYVTAGRFSAGEAADYAGPVDDRRALDIRLIDVCFHLFRFESGSFEFVVNQEPPWTAERATDIGPIVDTVQQIVRAWPAVEAVLPSFDVRPEQAPDLPEDSLTLSRTGFKVLTMVDGKRTVRQIAREVGHSVVEVGPVLRDLIEHGAVTLPPAKGARAEPSVVLPSNALHAVREAGEGEGAPVEMVTSVPDESVALAGEALERERAELAAKAGLQGPGPVPEAGSPAAGGPADEPDEAEDTTITSDRGALLRLFSGLRDQT
jgi:hypothetical protein